ncbi:hypothetical protein OBV_38970 [Oscillibacter valericigenes Sjm18-20]|nr:hypothetical protein OBV_38970 [Oscillibacter valericigenes Sjm18-20]
MWMQEEMKRMLQCPAVQNEYAPCVSIEFGFLRPFSRGISVDSLFIALDKFKPM